MQNWRLQIDVKVSDNWVEDGFNMSERLEEIKDSIAAMLPLAYSNEVVVDVKLVKQPDEKVIRKLQGYEK